MKSLAILKPRSVRMEFFPFLVTILSLSFSLSLNVLVNSIPLFVYDYVDNFFDLW